MSQKLNYESYRLIGGKIDEKIAEFMITSYKEERLIKINNYVDVTK